MSDPSTLQDDQPESNPRAFCQASGVVFICVGGILLAGSCCWGSVALFFERPIQPKDPDRAVVAVLSDSEAYQLWTMATVYVTIVAGLAASAIGVALQHERPKSGRLAMAMSGAVALYFAGYLVFSILNPAFGRIAVSGVMTLVWAALFLLAGHSAELLKRFPPPADTAWTKRDEDDLQRT